MRLLLAHAPAEQLQLPRCGRLALSKAARHGHTEAVELLLLQWMELGLGMEQASETLGFGEALVNACLEGRLKTAALLLDWFAPGGEVDERGGAAGAAHTCVSQPAAVAAGVAADAAATASATAATAATPSAAPAAAPVEGDALAAWVREALRAAVAHGHILVTRLLTGCYPNACAAACLEPGGTGRPAPLLIAAVRRGDEELVRELLAVGPPDQVLVKDGSGNIALTTALQYPRTKEGALLSCRG